MIKLLKSKSGTANFTIVVFIAILFYLVGLTIFLGFMEKNVKINYSNESYSTDSTIFPTHSFTGNIVNNVSDLPSWFNTLFIIIPFEIGRAHV